MDGRERAWVLEAGGSAGVALDGGALERLDTFMELLLEASTKENLTGFRDRDALLRDGIGQAISLWPLARGSGPVADIGSGSGLPGLVWAILAPERTFVLIESRRRRAAFLSRAVEVLGLPSEVEGVRAETLGRGERRESFAVATARAVGSVGYVAELALPLLGIGGLLILPKGPTQRGELEEARPLISDLGGRPRAVPEPTVAGEGRRGFVVLVEKTHATPEIYPRGARRLGTSPVSGRRGS